MATIKKDYSKAKPIVESGLTTAGTTYVNNSLHYTAQLCAPGGPPYVHFSLVLSEEEMLRLVTGWLETLNRQRELQHRKAASQLALNEALNRGDDSHV